MKKEEKIKLMEIQTDQPVRTLEATNWKAFIQSAIKTGLESPTPYKVIPYKNGIGIRRIIFLNSGKRNCLPFDNTNAQKDCHDLSLIK